MVSFNFVALSLVLSQCEASLRSASVERRLSYQKIAGYEPRSQVTDHAAIDLDQAEIENQLAAATQSSFSVAKGIYENGGYSKSFAEVSVQGKLPSSIQKGTEIIGQNEEGVQVVGKALEDFPDTATVIRVQYSTSDLQATYVDCQVGGLVEASAANLNGCFADSGTLAITGVGTVTYTYNKRQHNQNGRTIQGFSTAAQDKMFDCPDCPYPDYQKFYNYYGKHDYADKWVQAAFSGTSTDFANGNANFGSYGFPGLTEAIKKGTAYMNIFMYVIREMEDALDDCQTGCIDCNDDPVHAWDEAVAFYTGSLEGIDGSGNGNLLYALADKRCANFKTCGRDGQELEGSAKINHDIFQQFKAGQRDLLQGKCSDARKKKERIAQLMYVPMIQGTLRYAFITATESTSGEKAEAEGAIFAAAVLPTVHACNEGDAQKIYENMSVGSGKSTDYKAVKKAFEKNYGCMKISCSDVGGLYDDGNMEYFEGMEPCSGGGSSKNKVAIAVGSIVGALVVIVLAALLMRWSRRRTSGVDDKFSAATAGTEVA